MTKQHETVGTGNDCFFLLNIQLGHDRQVYTREYQKISDALAKVFGVLKTMSIFGYIFIIPYSRLAFFLEGINLVIDNSQSVVLPKKCGASQSTKGQGKNIRVTSKSVWKLYFSYESLTDLTLDRYFQIFKSALEIKSTFYHFLEFKKLLLILFDRDQQTLFHSLPRYISRIKENVLYVNNRKSKLASFLELEDYNLNLEGGNNKMNRKSGKLKEYLEKSVEVLKNREEKDKLSLRILAYYNNYNIPNFQEEDNIIIKTIENRGNFSNYKEELQNLDRSEEEKPSFHFFHYSNSISPPKRNKYWEAQDKELKEAE